MKIGWLSNAPWTTVGYGTSTNEVVWRLQDAGHEVICICFYGLQGAPLKSNGMLFLPTGVDPYGNDVLYPDAEYYKMDIVISNMDVWVLKKQAVERIKWCPWFPVDHDPVPHMVTEILKSAYKPIVYSQWGLEKLKEAGVSAQYIPISVNTNAYKPINRMEARLRQGFRPDSFIIGIVSANKGWPSRKAFDQQIRAFAIFQQRHKDAVLYLHTDMTGAYGEDINSILYHANIPQEAVQVPSVYKYNRGLLGPDFLNDAFNSMDVLSNATRAEGFGIPIVEAQAAGCPVVVTDFSSMPELVGAGWKVSWKDKFFSQNSYQVTPDVDSIVDCYEKAYAARGNQALRDQARAFALGYESDKVVKEQWLPFLDGVASELKVKPVENKPQLTLQPPPGLSRSQRRKWRKANGVSVSV